MNLGHESETVEYKKSTGELKEGVASIAAILNKHGHGELYFGVKNDGDVCGMQVADATLREIGQAIDQSIEPRIHPIVEKLDDGEGRDYIRVSFSGSDTPYSCKGVFRSRVSDSDILMSATEIKRMSVAAHFAEHPWDGQPSDYSIDEVEEDTLADFVQKGRDSGRISFEYVGAEDALLRLGLMKDGQLANAAAVLFCRPRTIMLKMAIFATDARINILDMKQEQESLLKLADMAEDYIMRNIKWRFVISGAIEREEVPEIPRAAVREALMNAFCHRDYTSGLAVQVDILGEKIEIFSPGWFPDGLSPEMFLDDEARPFVQSPNQLIASSLYKAKAIESYGTGIRRIRELCEEADINFEYQTTEQGTIIRFYRPQWFEAENETGREFANNEEAALYLARTKGTVTVRTLVELTGISRNTAGRTLSKLATDSRLKWHGTSSTDPSQYYTLD